MGNPIDIRQMYLSILKNKCRLKMEDVWDDGTYLIRMLSPVMRFNRDTRNFVPTFERIYYLTPHGIYGNSR